MENDGIKVFDGNGDVVEEQKAPESASENDAESSDTETPDNKDEENDSESSSDENIDDDENESEDSEASENDEDQEDDTEKAPKKKPRGVKRRIAKLKQREQKALEAAEYWKKEALKTQQKPPENEDEPPQTEGKPQVDDFDTTEDYIDALTDWKVKEQLKVHKASEQEDKAKAQQVETAKKWQENIKSFMEKTPDFEDVMEDADGITFYNNIDQAFFTSDNGPAVLYELGKDLELANKISKLSKTDPMAAVREIGKVEARVSKTSSKSEKINTKSNAPKPVNPTRGNGKVKVKKDIYDTDISQSDYERLREEQVAQKRKGRR